MSGGIFLIQNDNNLVEMTEQPYDTEAFLQELLAKYPNLLAGDQMDAAMPRRWLLISREMGVPSEEDGSDRWSLDHLFLDQEAIPTLIEVKRSSDTRIRREVVGQMLDYAANAVVYWPVETIRARFEEQCRERGADPATEIETLVSAATPVEEFWQRVKTNLQAGRVRLVFVADLIPPELHRIVEFLNGQMDPAEVLAVEIKQFVGPGLRTLVPRLIGKTAEAEQKKGGSRPGVKQWDEVSFFQDLQERRGEKEVNAARAILNWAKTNLSRLSWGRGNKNGSCFPVLDHKGQWHTPVAVWTFGQVEIPFKNMLNRLSFGDEVKRLELRECLNRIPGISIAIDRISKNPNFALSTLTNDDAMAQFLSVLDWYVEQVKSASS